MAFCESPKLEAGEWGPEQLPMTFSIFLPILGKQAAKNIAPIVTIHINISFSHLNLIPPSPTTGNWHVTLFLSGSESFYSYISIAIMWQRYLIIPKHNKNMVKGSLNPILFSSYTKLLQVIILILF